MLILNNKINTINSTYFKSHFTFSIINFKFSYYFITFIFINIYIKKIIFFYKYYSNPIFLFKKIFKNINKIKNLLKIFLIIIFLLLNLNNINFILYSKCLKKIKFLSKFLLQNFSFFIPEYLSIIKQIYINCIFF